jgi:NitT/TauT family transport system substrate-binding protein
MNDNVRTMFLLRILVALWLVAEMAPTRASAETLRIGLQTTGTFAWQLPGWI